MQYRVKYLDRHQIRKNNELDSPNISTGAMYILPKWPPCDILGIFPFMHQNSIAIAVF